MHPYARHIPLDEPETAVSIPIEPDILKAVKQTFFRDELDGSWYSVHLIERRAAPPEHNAAAFESLPW